MTPDHWTHDGPVICLRLPGRRQCDLRLSTPQPEQPVDKLAALAITVAIFQTQKEQCP